MLVVPLIIDCEVSYAHGENAGGSLLSLPLGTGSVLNYLSTRLAKHSSGKVLVMPGFPADEDYEHKIRASASVPVKVICAENLAEALHEYETSDFMLVVEPRNWSRTGYDVATIISDFRGYHGASHAIGVGSDYEGTRELVECDSDGCVKRVQRFYNQKHWPEVAGTSIVYSLVPARMMADIDFATLAELRSTLYARGSLSRDVPVATDIIDLQEEAGLLAVHEKVLDEEVSRESKFVVSNPSSKIFVGKDCNIHRSARIIPPVVIQQGVKIEEDVTVVGPTVIGPGCNIHQGATVVQSVLLSGTELSTGTTVRHRLVYGRCSGSISAVSSGLPSASAPAEQIDNYSHGKDIRASSVNEAPGGRLVHYAIKRVMDVVLSFLALLILSPFLLVVAILIKLDSPGPVFFIHYRERKKGKEFPCFKFRTMGVDAHQQQRELYKQNVVDGPQFKLHYDHRVTRVGRWLRATNIDELPQLINVLLGHMSLVGPRPSPFRENQICVPWRRARLSICPGITGLWQVCRGDDRSRGDFHEWIYYDLAYVRNFSIWLDLKIILATFLTLGGRWSVPLRWMAKT